jgi:hypothetical protein
LILGKAYGHCRCGHGTKGVLGVISSVWEGPEIRYEPACLEEVWLGSRGCSDLLQAKSSLKVMRWKGLRFGGMLWGRGWWHDDGERYVGRP